MRGITLIASKIERGPRNVRDKSRENHDKFRKMVSTISTYAGPKKGLNQGRVRCKWTAKIEMQRMEVFVADLLIFWKNWFAISAI